MAKFVMNKRSKFNTDTQYYKDISVRLILRNYDNYGAVRFIINETNQNVWIPKKHLNEDCTIKDGENIDYVFRKAQTQLAYAGVWKAIPGIKRQTDVTENIVIHFNTGKSCDTEAIV